MSIVVIPAYKPDEVLTAIVDKLWNDGCQIIVVDDGSGEKYQPVFEEIRECCIVLRHFENRGKGAAIKTALSYIKEEMWDSGFIGIMDSDGQHLPEDMMKLFSFAGNHEKSLVLGVRELGDDMPLKSRLGNRITKAVFQFACRVEVSDTQTGLRVFDSALLQRMLSVEGERYEYEMNVLIAMAQAGISIKEVPIHTIYRDKNNSNSHFRVLRDSIRIYKDILKFTLASFSSFILDYLLFAVLMYFLPHKALPMLAANIAARLVSAFYNYSVNCRFVFYTDRKMRTAVQYFELGVFLLIMNNLILEICVQTLHISVYLAKVITECLLFLLSWLVQNRFIFRREKIFRALTEAGRESF